MPTKKQPHFGSLQFKPQKRAKRPYARVRSWSTSKENKALGFAGYKVGMAHVMYNESRKNARYFKENVTFPVTILECPPLIVYGIRFYAKKYGKSVALFDHIISSPNKNLSRKICVVKKPKALKEIKDYSDIVLLVHTQPSLTGIGKKKPEVFELPFGGANKLDYAKSMLGKQINFSDVFSSGHLVDLHGLTKGKGFQGPVKRDGIGLRSHKSEKARRAAVLAGEGIAKVSHSAHQAGQLGYNLRTIYNNLIIKISEEDITPKSGFHKYGKVKNNVVLIKGSVQGPKKSLVILTKPIRNKETHQIDVSWVSVP